MDDDEEEQMDQTILGHGSTRTPVIVSVQGEGGWEEKGEGRIDGWMDGLEGGRRGERKEEEGVLVGL